jgi:hypothetical protein
MQYLVFLVVGLLWGLYACSIQAHRNPKVGALRQTWTFVLNFVGWFLLIPTAVISRLLYNKTLIVG